MANEPSAPEPSPPPAAAETAGPRSRGNLRLLLGFGSLAGLFVLAMWGSWLFRSEPAKHDDPSKSAKDAPKDLFKDRAKVSPADILARGDTALRQVRIAEALSHYKDFLASGAVQSAEFTYRLGLCSESVGQLDDAIAGYRLAIGESSSASLTFACHLAMARCLMRQNSPIDARLLLYPFLLDERRHHHLPQAFVTDACFIAALSLAQEGTKLATNKMSQDDPISFASVPLEIRHYFEEIATPVQAPSESSAMAIPVPLAVQKRSKSEAALVLCVERAGQSAGELLTQLAEEGGMKAEWSFRAKKNLADRTLSLHLHNWELRDVLEQAADYLDLICRIDGDVVRFSTKSELDSKQVKSLRRVMTRRFLQAALHADQTHPYAGAACLELGNNESVQGRWGDAAFWYNRVVRDATHSPHVASAYFNLARAHLGNNDIAQVRKTYFRVVDQSPGSELALRACIQIGQSYLQDDDPRQAIQQLRRAQPMAVESRYHPLAALALTAAYMHNGDLEDARRTLVQSKAAVQQQAYLPTASFLDRYLQYRLSKASKDSIAGQRDTSELIGILWRNKDETVLGPYGQWLIAQAYRDLDFLEPAERLLRVCLKDAQGPFKACVEYALADTLMKRNQRDEAGKIFARWAEVESPYRARSRLQLAKIDLEEKRYRECADACRKLWNERSISDQTALLGLWGAALEGNGELAKAAKCYAGKAPD